MRTDQETLDDLEREGARAQRLGRDSLVCRVRVILGLVRDHRAMAPFVALWAREPCRGLGPSCEALEVKCVPCRAREVVRLQVD